MKLVICIHGIGGKKFSFYFLLQKLRQNHYAEAFSYASTRLSLRESADKLDKFIDKQLIKYPNVNGVVLIGHSAGGRVALLSKHELVMGAITIASPLKGAYLAERLGSVTSWFYGPMLAELAKPHDEQIIPLFPVVCITAELLFEFDGRLWKSEMIYDNAITVYNLENSHHSGIQLMNKRMEGLVDKALNDILKNSQVMN